MHRAFLPSSLSSSSQIRDRCVLQSSFSSRITDSIKFIQLRVLHVTSPCMFVFCELNGVMGNLKSDELKYGGAFEDIISKMGKGSERGFKQFGGRLSNPTGEAMSLSMNCRFCLKVGHWGCDFHYHRRVPNGVTEVGKGHVIAHLRCPAVHNKCKHNIQRAFA